MNKKFPDPIPGTFPSTLRLAFTHASLFSLGRRLRYGTREFNRRLSVRLMLPLPWWEEIKGRGGCFLGGHQN